MPKQVLNNAGTTVYYHDGSSFVEFTPCSGWTGRFTIKTSPYVSNDTGGGTGRTAGATDAVGTINWRPNKASGPPELLDGDDILLQLWLTDDIDDGYWQGVAKFSEFNIDTTPQEGAHQLGGEWGLASVQPIGRRREFLGLIWLATITREKHVMSSPEENVMAVGATITLGGVDYELPNIGVGWMAAGRDALRSHLGNPFEQVYEAVKSRNIQGVLRREMMAEAGKSSRLGVTTEELQEWFQNPEGLAWMIWWALTKCGGRSDVTIETIREGVYGLTVEGLVETFGQVAKAAGITAMTEAAKNSPESPEVNLLETEAVESPGEPST
jgi:hypothetical protein